MMKKNIVSLLLLLFASVLYAQTFLLGQKVIELLIHSFSKSIFIAG